VGRYHAASVAADRGRNASCHRSGRLWSRSGTGKVPPSTIPHRGVDFNYIGGRDARLNKSFPALRSPVDGIVENAGQGDVERIAISDKNGFVHELLHTYSRHVAIGDPVAAGQIIGTMGNTGTRDSHVHYQLKDTGGKVIDPTEFWDRQGSADPNPDPPAYLQQHQQYLHAAGVNPRIRRCCGYANDARSYAVDCDN
jgi:murein DD-endopeptidase MepM/ murein hydrolase activator NlpD